jgi:hypothetical protein
MSALGSIAVAASLGGKQTLEGCDGPSYPLLVDISPFVAGVVALIAILTAHVAGAGYVVAERAGKSSRHAVVRTIISVALVLLAIHLAR